MTKNCRANAGEGQPDIRHDARPPARRLTIFGFLLVSAWIVGGGFVFLTNQPETVLTNDWQKSVKTTVQTVLPEQWGFFTRSPREDELLPYGQDAEGGWSSLSQYPHSQAQHWFGWDRASRAQGIEIGVLFNEVADKPWHKCGARSPLDGCLKDADSGHGWVTVTNPTPEPTVCGRAAISKALPPPWAFAHIGQAKQEFSVVLLEVQC